MFHLQVPKTHLRILGVINPTSDSFGGPISQDYGFVVDFVVGYGDRETAVEKRRERLWILSGLVD